MFLFVYKQPTRPTSAVMVSKLFNDPSNSSVIDMPLVVSIWRIPLGLRQPEAFGPLPAPHDASRLRAATNVQYILGSFMTSAMSLSTTAVTCWRWYSRKTSTSSPVDGPQSGTRESKQTMNAWNSVSQYSVSAAMELRNRG